MKLVTAIEATISGDGALYITRFHDGAASAAVLPFGRCRPSRLLLGASSSKRSAETWAVPLVKACSTMASICCLAGIEENKIGMLAGAVRQADVSRTTLVAQLRVTELAHLAPAVIVCDLDRLDVDPLELLRQIRFVLPRCILAVYSGVFTHSWALSCHLAGATCMLSKESTGAQLSHGLREGMQSGCFTDPRFDATDDARTA